LLEADARVVEMAYERQLEQAAPPVGEAHQTRPAEPDQAVTAQSLLCEAAAPPDAMASSFGFPKEPPRKRSKAHLSFVRGQPCTICKQTPSDAHHLKFAQPIALGRKVSDEFTVPLCRSHHLALHRHGNERAWWADLKISPLPIANELWACSPVQANAVPAPDRTGSTESGTEARPR
jgi:hypothetical protein